MASGTIYGSTGNQYIDSKIEWTSTANTSANTSTVTASLYYKRNNTGFTTQGTGSFVLTIDGQKTSASKHMTITGSAWVLAVSATKTVSHNDDGSKSITISATGSIPDTSLSSTSCSGRVSLDNIARASKIASAANKNLGSACSIKWTPLSKSFRYKLKFSLGDWNYTTGAIHPNTTSAYTYTGYTLPIADVAPEITGNPPTGTMTVTLYTFSDSEAKTQVGSEDSETFTVTVPNTTATKPDVSMTLAPVSSLGSAFSSLYVQGKSKVKATISGSGKYDAKISSYKMYVQGKAQSSYESGYLTSAGTVTVKGRATDSRGYYNDATEDINVIPYSAPSLLPASGESAIICARCDAGGNISESGTYLKIKARRSYSKVESGGAQKNFCIIRYRIREETTNTYSAWVTLLAKTAATDTIDVKLANVVSSAETAYFVQLGVVDDIGESDAFQFSIPSDFVTIDIPEDLKGRRIGLLRYAQDTDEPGIDVGAPIHGGSVDNLTLGDRITASSTVPIDLNDFKTPGNYYSPSGTNSQYIANTPYTGGGFGLIVRELQSANYIRQELYYGRTRWSRHWNGTEWSEWLRFLMSPAADDTVEDFVIEVGTYDTGYGTWQYKKWFSGTYQMFGYFDVTPTESTLRSGGLVYRTNSIGITAPFPISSACVSGSVMGYSWISNGGISEDHKYVAFRLISDKAMSTTTAIEVRLFVTGNFE